ncbi:MAG: hypothetical protein H0W36_10335 [Gemmatimonadetes bacterium]|nr:hypothetical protein [Gemmatimonadota bacterium]
MTWNPRRWGRTALVMGWTGLFAIVPACDWNDPDEVQNSANEAVIRAQFFASRTNRVPVPGVRMLVEAPADDTERPYNGPDVIGVSGEDGVAVVRIFPGLDEEGQGSGGDPSQGPQNPLELPPPLVFADVAIVIIYQGEIVPFIATGLTVGSGRLYDLGSIFLDEFNIGVD